MDDDKAGLDDTSYKVSVLRGKLKYYADIKSNYEDEQVQE